MQRKTQRDDLHPLPQSCLCRFFHWLSLRFWQQALQLGLDVLLLHMLLEGLRVIKLAPVQRPLPHLQQQPALATDWCITRARLFMRHTRAVSRTDLPGALVLQPAYALLQHLHQVQLQVDDGGAGFTQCLSLLSWAKDKSCQLTCTVEPIYNLHACRACFPQLCAQLLLWVRQLLLVASPYCHLYVNSAKVKC